MRFASAFDHPDECKILNADGIKTMFARPDGLAGHTKDGKAKNAFYACGWQVRTVGGGKINAWHNGALDGTETILVRRHDGVCWAVLFNTRKGLVGKIDPLMHQAADKVKRWPAKDLFKTGL